MAKSKVHMSKEIKTKCHAAIHTASAAAAAAGAIPIPFSDAIPIIAAQVSMIIALGKVFDVTLSEGAAKSIAAVGLAKETGRAVASNVIKAIPGPGQIVGPLISAATAATLTEALGWIVADDFFRMYNGEQPENLVEATVDIKDIFSNLKIKK